MNIDQSKLNRVAYHRTPLIPKETGDVEFIQSIVAKNIKKNGSFNPDDEEFLKDISSNETGIRFDMLESIERKQLQPSEEGLYGQGLYTTFTLESQFTNRHVDLYGNGIIKLLPLSARSFIFTKDAPSIFGGNNYFPTMQLIIYNLNSPSVKERCLLLLLFTYLISISKAEFTIDKSILQSLNTLEYLEQVKNLKNLFNATKNNSIDNSSSLSRVENLIIEFISGVLSGIENINTFKLSLYRQYSSHFSGTKFSAVLGNSNQIIKLLSSLLSADQNEFRAFLSYMLLFNEQMLHLSHTASTLVMMTRGNIDLKNQFVKFVNPGAESFDKVYEAKDTFSIDGIFFTGQQDGDVFLLYNTGSQILLGWNLADPKMLIFPEWFDFKKTLVDEVKLEQHEAITTIAEGNLSKILEAVKNKTIRSNIIYRQNQTAEYLLAPLNNYEIMSELFKTRQLPENILVDNILYDFVTYCVLNSYDECLKAFFEVFPHFGKLVENKKTISETNTILHLAVAQGCATCLELLFQNLKSLKPKALNSLGQTPYEYLKSSSMASKQFEDIFKKYNADVESFKDDDTSLENLESLDLDSVSKYELLNKFLTDEKSAHLQKLLKLNQIDLTMVRANIGLSHALISLNNYELSLQLSKHSILHKITITDHALKKLFGDVKEARKINAVKTAKTLPLSLLTQLKDSNHSLLTWACITYSFESARAILDSRPYLQQKMINQQVGGAKDTFFHTIAQLYEHESNEWKKSMREIFKHIARYSRQLKLDLSIQNVHHETVAMAIDKIDDIKRIFRNLLSPNDKSLWVDPEKIQELRSGKRKLSKREILNSILDS